LVYRKRDRKKLGEERAVGMRGRGAENEEVKQEKKMKQVMNLLTKNQIYCAWGSIESHGAALLNMLAMRAQVEAKYLGRKMEIPTDITKECPVDNVRGLKDNLMGVRKGASPGTGALRPEFLKILAKLPSPSQMSLLEDFSMRHL
jgi:hypothetical protein